MQTRQQRTIAKPVEFKGRGLFHGIEAKATAYPADAGTGIVFRRTDLPDAADIPARCQSISRVPRRTVLQAANGARIETVEHMMSAFAGLQIDNCLVEIDAPEVPAYDGSCLDFCHGFLDAGIQFLSEPVHEVLVRESASVESDDGKQTMTIRPYLRNCQAYTYHLDYGARSAVSPQVMSIELAPDVFVKEIAPARTFVLESEIRALQSLGYGKHLTARDIIVIGPSGVIDNELRWQNEGVRHKILDCIGDLALSGRDFCGHVKACRSGHHMNHVLAGQLEQMAQPDSGLQAAA